MLYFFFQPNPVKIKVNHFCILAKFRVETTVLQNSLPRVWGSLVHFHCHSVVVCFSSCSGKVSLFLRTLSGFSFWVFWVSWLFKCHSDCRRSPLTSALLGSCPFCVATNYSWVTLNEALPQQIWAFLSSVPMGRTPAWTRMLFSRPRRRHYCQTPKLEALRPGGLARSLGFLLWTVNLQGFSSSVIVECNHCWASPI